MKYITFVLLLILSLNSYGQANSCHVMFDYKNESIEVALNTWKSWCKSNFLYDTKDLAKVKISGDHGLISLEMALNIAFEGSELGWYPIDDKTIKIKPINRISRYLSISNTFQGTSLKKVFNIWTFNHKLDINYNQEGYSRY